MKINPLHNFIFSDSFPILEIVLQSFLMLKGSIFLIFFIYNTNYKKQKSLLNNICIHKFKTTYLFYPQFQLGFHIIY